ncbi:MAG TPA: aminoglycoside phosphotransferase family protein [Actinomycetota bacterium]
MATSSVIVPEQLAANCQKTLERRQWLDRLPKIVQELEGRWSLSLEPPFDGPSCAWVAPALARGTSSVVLKVGMPHFEAEDEVAALRLLDGDPTVRVLAWDEEANAMLLERCRPGTVLRRLPEPEQDVVIARMLRRFWRRLPQGHGFHPLEAMTAVWSAEARADSDRWPDVGLVEEGLRLFHELPRTASHHVLLATDLHAGSVLAAEREPWLVIDPKPFVGDPAYDATQHLLNCPGRMQRDPLGTIRRFADLLGLDEDRVRLWMFARYTAEGRDSWAEGTVALARRLM